MNAVIVGHSFVRRLQRDTCPGLHGNISCASLGGLLARSLQVDKHYYCVYTYCDHINFISDLNTFTSFIRVNNISPDIVVLDIGSNDLAKLKAFNRNACLNLAGEVFDICQTILSSTSTKCVVVKSVLPRTARIQSSPQTFSNNLDLYNHCIKQFCDTEPRINYIKTKGFYQHLVTTWSNDGIHCNKTSAQRYKIRLRHSLLYNSYPASCNY